MTKLRLKIIVLACVLANTALAQQDPDMESPALRAQQAELDTVLSDIRSRLALSEKTFREAQAKKIKYDTIGLGAWRAEMAALNMEKKALERQFIKRHPDYFISLLALGDVIGPLPTDVHGLQKLYQGLSEVLRKTPTGQKTKVTLDRFESVSVGKIAPEFSAPDTAGKIIHLSDFRGKYVLVDFWASWCVPCREENPIVVETWKKFRNRNFDILSVSLDQPGKKEAWKKAIHEDHLDWQHVSDLKYWNSDVARLYAVRSIPQNFLIDPQGKIIAANLRGPALAQALEKFIQ